MAREPSPQPNPDHMTIYHIKIKGHLGPEWSEWFEGLTVTREDSGETLLAGPVADQAALHGLLRKVRDAGMPLVSVTRVNADHSDGSAASAGM